MSPVISPFVSNQKNINCNAFYKLCHNSFFDFWITKFGICIFSCVSFQLCSEFMRRFKALLKNRNPWLAFLMSYTGSLPCSNASSERSAVSLCFGIQDGWAEAIELPAMMTNPGAYLFISWVSTCTTPPIQLTGATDPSPSASSVKKNSSRQASNRVVGNNQSIQWLYEKGSVSGEACWNPSGRDRLILHRFVLLLVHFKWTVE